MSGRKLALLALPLAISAATPAAAQQSGVAMTAESGGRQAGCVEWSYETLERPTQKHPDRVNVVFTYRNKCNREIHVQLRSQTADLYQVVGRSGDVTLAPGEVYSPRNAFRNYIFFNPPKDRFLHFWVIQSEQRFNIRNNNILDMNRCNPNFKGGVKNSKRFYPPCPPGNTYR